MPIDVDGGIQTLGGRQFWGDLVYFQGWRIQENSFSGSCRLLDPDNKKHDGLVPYGALPESEKDYDREMAEETLKAVIALGYRIVPPSN